MRRAPGAASENFARPDTDTEVSICAATTRPGQPHREREAGVAEGGCGLGGANNVVPGILIEVGPRLAYELVKVLELFAAGAEFSGRRWDAGRFVHGTSPKMRDGFCLGLSPIASRASAPSRKLLWLVVAGREQKIPAARGKDLPWQNWRSGLRRLA